MKAFVPPLCALFAVSVVAQSQDLGGAKVTLADPACRATATGTLKAPFKLQIHVDPGPESTPIPIRVEVPNSGPKAWPSADVEVRDASGKALLVQRSGIEWFKMLVKVPLGATDFVVQAVEPSGGRPKPTSDKDRSIQDPVSGIQLRIAKWHDGRAAALSIRFDDAHPTQLSKAAPILREYGFRGTFMINPGVSEPGSRRVSEFEQHHTEWEALAKQGDHELANHSAHHRGGFGDQDMEAEIGEAAQAIWRLTPGKSQLMALNLGGGTRWETTRTLRYYLDKYHQFDTSENSTGMDDSYGNRVENFRRILDQHVARGLWCRIHYHYIGDGLSSTEANFRAALDITKQHANDLWVAGMADIYKYETERNATKLTLIRSDARSLQFQISRTTDPALYDQPLTMEVLPPAAWNAQKIVVKGSQGNILATRAGKVEGAAALRFEVPPDETLILITAPP